MKKWTKIVLITLAAVILLPVAGLAIAGALPGSGHMVATVTIHRKPEEVWPWLYRKEHVMQWVSWLVEIREEPGEPQAGKSGVWVMEDQDNNNERVEFTGTVQAVEPYRRINLKLDAPGGIHGFTEYRLTPLADGSTRFDSDSRYVLESAFARFMLPLIYWQANKKVVGDMARLKALIEAGK
ncbi:MAG: SRPBCC family protein [Candidatus Solibacter sp.]